MICLSDIYVFAIDVGKPENIGWADSMGNNGGVQTLESQLVEVGKMLSADVPVVLDFEAPIWVPHRNDFFEFNKARGGIENV